MQRSKPLHTEAWRVYAIALLNVLVSSNYLVHSCDKSGLVCGITIVPTNRTNIVDLSSSGCNDTHIWISWGWTTPEDCTVKSVAITGGYVCFTEDGSLLRQHLDSKHWPSSTTTEWSYEHNEWNTSAKSVANCTIIGSYEFLFAIDNECHQRLLPANIVCSNQVQPTHPPMMTSSSPIAMTTAYTSMLHTLSVQPTPTITPQLNASFQTLSETQIVVIITTGSIVALLLLTSFFAVMLMRWKNKKPIINYYNYDKDLLDFKPGFTPVIPEEMVFKEDAISIQSTITPLEKIESAFVLTDISTSPIPANQTQKLSQPKDYRQLG